MEESKLLDRPIPRKPRNEISISGIHYMFGTMIQYCLASENMSAKCHEMGARLGSRALMLVSYRDKVLKRETRVLGILAFISQTCWRTLFGRQGELFKCGDNEEDYMLIDRKFHLTKYCFESRGEGYVDYGALGAGIIEGILCDSEFPAEVTAHTVNADPKDRTVTFLIKFFPSVLTRESKYA